MTDDNKNNKNNNTIQTTTTTTPVRNAFMAPALFTPMKATVSSFQGLAAHPLDPLLVGSATPAPELSSRRTQLMALIQRARPMPTTPSPSSVLVKRTQSRVEDDLVVDVDNTNKKQRRADDDDDDEDESGDVKLNKQPVASVVTVDSSSSSSSSPSAPNDPAATTTNLPEFLSLRRGDQNAHGLPVWFNDSVVKAPSLHDELVALLELLEPLESEDALRRSAIERLQTIAMNNFGACTVIVFGSLRAGCSLPSSDVDVTLIGPQFPSGSIRGNSALAAPLRKLDQLLRSVNSSGALRPVQGSGGPPSGCLMLPNARVPLIKWSDWHSGIDVDISFNMTEGSLTSDWVRSRIEEWPCFRPLLLVLKLLVQQRGLSDPANGGVGSYTLAVMVSAFLCVREKHYRTARDRSHNVAFDPALPLSTAGVDLGRQLTEFLHFFGICFNAARCLVHSAGVALRSDHEHALYVVNPVDSTKNTASASFRYDAVQDLFRHCFMMLDSTDASTETRFATPLMRIITVTEALQDRRSQIKRGAKRGARVLVVGNATAPVQVDNDDGDEFVSDQPSSEGVIMV